MAKEYEDAIKYLARVVNQRGYLSAPYGYFNGEVGLIADIYGEGEHKVRNDVNDLLCKIRDDEVDDPDYYVQDDWL